MSDMLNTIICSWWELVHSKVPITRTQSKTITRDSIHPYLIGGFGFDFVPELEVPVGCVILVNL